MADSDINQQQQFLQPGIIAPDDIEALLDPSHVKGKTLIKKIAAAPWMNFHGKTDAKLRDIIANLDKFVLTRTESGDYTVQKKPDESVHPPATESVQKPADVSPGAAGDSLVGPREVDPRLLDAFRSKTIGDSRKAITQLVAKDIPVLKTRSAELTKTSTAFAQKATAYSNLGKLRELIDKKNREEVAHWNELLEKLSTYAIKATSVASTSSSADNTPNSEKDRISALLERVSDLEEQDVQNKKLISALDERISALE